MGVLRCETASDLASAVAEQSYFISQHSKWMATQIHTFEVEPTGKRATTARDGTLEMGFVPAPTRTGHLGGGGGDLLLLYAENRWEARHACRRGGIMIG